MSVFKNISEKYSIRHAVIDQEGRCYTYYELIQLAGKIGTLIPERSLVFALCTNTIGSLVGYISFLNSRSVPLMLDASTDEDFLKDLVARYRPGYLWIPEERSFLYSSDKIVFSGLNYLLVKNDISDNTPLYNELALLLTTSGSTGSPKLVRLSYENIRANAESIAEYLVIDEKERPVTTLPMHYSFGLSVINSHLIKGATLLLTSKTLMESSFWSFVKEHGATSLSGVPYTYEMLKKLRFFKMDLPSLRTMTQAGGKLNNDLNKEFSEFCRNSGRRFFVMYGQTEATARMSYLPPEYSIPKLGSMGIAIPGGEFSLINDSGSLIEGHDVVGELVYKGKNVSLGYGECSDDLNRGDENNGVLITGDMAKRDEDNFYYIVGRKKRFIKIYGNRVNLDETERLLKNIVTDCACIGTDDHMVIYVTDKSRVKVVTEFITAKTKINHNAIRVRHIDEIPKNSSGKTIYSSLDL